MAVFKESKFNEIFGLLADPYRLILMNFFMGLLRGLGFVVAVVLAGTIFIALNIWPF